MKKTVIIAILAIAILSAGAYWFLNRTTSDPTQKGLTPEELVLQQTLEISKEYLALRLRTDDVW